MTISIDSYLKIKENQIQVNTRQDKNMEAFDLDPSLFHSIFKQRPVSPQAMKELQEWQHNLEPSFNLLKSILTQYFSLDNFQTLNNTVKQINLVLLSLQQQKCSKCFLRAFLATIKVHWQQIQKSIDLQTIVAEWSSINPQILEYYFQTFGVMVDTLENKESKASVMLPLEEYELRIKFFIDKKQYDNAIILIKLIGYPQVYVKMLLEKMANNKDASKAANLIKSHKIDPKIVPGVGDRLNKNMVRYFLKNHGWELAEQIFQDQPQAIACLVQDLIFKNKAKEALSLWWRHRDIMNFIIKQESLDFFKKQASLNEEDIKNQIIDNSLFKDYFGPSNPTEHLSLKDFGIERNQVIWVDNTTDKEMEELISEIAQAEMLAIDTESIVGKNKLERTKCEPASLVQIAFEKKIFILDGLKGKNKKLQETFLDFIAKGKPILGHAIGNDLDATLFSLGFTQKEVSLIKFDNNIDTCSLFKAIYPKERYSNLAHICKIILKKEICKQQTLTNWARRPLRENQLHYAAMDAFCVIKIYEVLKEEVGENMLNYFLDQGI